MRRARPSVSRMEMLALDLRSARMAVPPDDARLARGGRREGMGEREEEFLVRDPPRVLDRCLRRELPRHSTDETFYPILFSAR